MNEIILLRELHISWKKNTLEKATVLCFAQSQREGLGFVAPVLCVCSPVGIPSGSNARCERHGAFCGALIYALGFSR